MNIGQVTKILDNPTATAVIAAVVSFVFGNVTGWIGAKRDRKRLAQEKYTQKYIIEGVDPLIHYYSRLKLQLIRRGYGDYMQVPDENPFPTEALAAMKIFCGEDPLARVNSFLNSDIGSYDDFERLVGTESSVYENIGKPIITFIDELDKALLRVRKDLEEKIAKMDKNYRIDNSKTCEIFHELTENHPHVQRMRAVQEYFHEDESETL